MSEWRYPLIKNRFLERWWVDDDDKRQELLDEIIQIGEAFVSYLIKNYRKKDYRRDEYLYCMGAVGAIGAEELLSEELFDSSTIQEIITLTEEKKYRKEAAFALLGLEIARKRGEYTPHILKVFDETHTKDLAAHLGMIKGDEAVVDSLIGALGEKFIEVVPTGLTSADYFIGPAIYASRSLLAIDHDRGIEAMTMAILQKFDSLVPDDMMEHHRKELLVDPGVRVLKPLILALSSENKIVRSKAASYLGEIGDPAAFDALAMNTTSDDVSTINSAAMALGTLGDPRAIPYLLPILAHKNMITRDVAKGALKRLKDVWDIAPFIEALGHDEQRVVLFSINALKELKDKGTIEPLSELLDHEDKKVKKQAQKAIKVLHK